MAPRDASPLGDGQSMAIRYWYPAVVAVALAATAAVSDSPSNSDEEFPGNRHVKVRLVLEETALTPGKGGHLGVIFDIAKGWHLYWRYAGDSGLPPKVEFKLPPGVTLEAAQWPAPTRHVQPGEMVDYIFEHQLVLIYPLTVSAGVSPGTKAAISADVEWLVCSDVCVPGRATVSAEFDVASGSQPSSAAALFAKVRQRHPVTTNRTAPFTAGWEKTDLVIHGKGAQRLAFFPYENDDGVFPKDMHSQGESKSGTLRLSYSEKVGTIKEIRGVVAVTRDGQESFFEFVTRGPGNWCGTKTK